MMELSGIVNLVSDLGAMGFVLYLSHRMTTHTIPQLAEQFDTSARQQRDDFRESLAQQRADFERWQEREHKECHRHLLQVTDGLREVGREVRGN